MKFIILPTRDPALTNSMRDSVAQIAQAAFTHMPAEEIANRFATYDFIGMAFAEEGMVGFTFISEHWIEKDCYLGFRLSAVHPRRQSQGVLNRLCLRLFCDRAATFYRSKIMNQRPHARLYMFCRVCSPIAYKAIHVGQKIFPDLIREAHGIIPPEIQWHFQRLQGALKLQNLDSTTGLLNNGAHNSGIHVKSRDISRAENWRLPWSSHVPEGSELMAIIPVSLGAILRSLPGIARLGIKRRAVRV